MPDTAAALGRFVLLAAAYPAKRTLDRPFGRVIVRYGETGNEENFIDGEPQPDGRLDETFRATRNGQMFVYLNQPVSGVFPGPVSQRELGQGEDLGLSHPRGERRWPKPRRTNDEAAKRRPVGWIQCVAI